jgi:signal transduction histidine kinase
MRRIVDFAVVAAAYAAAAMASQAFALAGTNVSLVWLPAGIGLAAMLIRGAWLWIAIPVAQMALTLNQGVFNAFRVTAATTIGTLVAYWLLRRLRFDPALGRLRDAVGLIVSTAAGGAIGTLVNGALRLVDVGPAPDAVMRMLNWWLGDVTGILLVVPLACTWAAPRTVTIEPGTRSREVLALTVLLAGIAAVTPIAFTTSATALLGVLYLAVALQMWAAVRFGPRGAAQAFGIAAGGVLLASRVAAGATYNSEPVSLTLLDGFLIVSAASTLLVASLVAEHTRAVSALAEARRLETVRRLAGGVAHDFNNLLMVILAHVDLIRQGRAVGGDLDAIQSAAKRAGYLTQQLLAYAQQVLLRPSRFNVNDVVGEVVGTLRAAAPPGVTFELSLGENLPMVQTDPDQLRRVLEQLCMRAIRAMPRGGRLTVATSAEAGSPAGGGAVIRVADTGEPLAADAQDRFFEPYPGPLPTGDPDTRSSGLELAMAQGFVRQVGGRITVEGAAGPGTAVTIVLPAGAR